MFGASPGDILFVTPLLCWIWKESVGWHRWPVGTANSCPVTPAICAELSLLLSRKLLWITVLNTDSWSAEWLSQMFTSMLLTQITAYFAQSPKVLYIKYFWSNPFQKQELPKFLKGGHTILHFIPYPLVLSPPQKKKLQNLGLFRRSTILVSHARLKPGGEWEPHLVKG